MNRKTRVWLIAAAGLVLVAVLSAGCGGKTGEAVRYHCPMHPTYVSDTPGDCPICGMRLVPLEKQADSRQPTADSSPTHPPESGTGHVHTEGYICTMCQQVHERAPGRCPVCGMKLVAAATAEHRHDDHDHGGDAAALASRPIDRGAVAGMATVDIAPEALRLAGVQLARTERGSLDRTIRTVGTVVADETRVRHVHTKIAGWVERLFVNFTGQPVRAGEPILAIYSPELLASQEEFLRALDTAARFAGSALPEVRNGGDDLLRAARRRLELFDVPASFIAELERTGQPQRTVALLAPVSGYVTAKATFEGHQIEPGMELFTITDLSRVWIEAAFYEYEAPALAVGETATLTLPYDPSVALAGRIAFIYPTLDVETRTLRVRFEFPNPKTALKPGMFANVELASVSRDVLVIPDSAVIDTGERQVVFVEVASGRFEPREVKLGARTAGKAEVRSGLAAGEQVVTRANFLLDSESRLRAALAAATTGPPASAPAPPVHEH